MNFYKILASDFISNSYDGYSTSRSGSSYGSRSRGSFSSGYAVDSTGREACAVSDFHPWGGCSVTCGQGFKRRFREFLYPDLARSQQCDTSVLVDTERCMGAFPSCTDVEEVRPGCEVTDWTEWGSCNATCGKGIQIRTRRYVYPPPHTDCRVDLYDDQSCEGTECTPEGNKKKLSKVTMPHCATSYLNLKLFFLEICTQAVDLVKCHGSFPRYHYDVSSQTCRKFSYGGCGGSQNIFETKDACERTCGSISELPSDSMAGYHQRVASYSNNYQGNSLQSPATNRLQQHQNTSPYSSSYSNYGSTYGTSRLGSSSYSSSYNSYGQSPVDCEVSDWTPWTKCSVACGRGHKYRTRFVRVHPQNGGLACPNLEHKRKCKGLQCPNTNQPYRYHHHHQHHPQQQQHHHHHHNNQYATGSYDG